MRAAAFLLIAAAAAAPWPVAAQGVRAKVAFGTQRASGYDLLGRKDDKISMSPIGVGGLVSMSISSITSMEIERPKALNEATFLMGQGKTADAIARLKQMARELTPYAGVPNNNAVDLVCDAVDLLRSAEQWPEAMELLGAIKSPGAGSNVARVDLLRAYCYTAMGKTLEAQTALKKAKQPERGDPLYPVAKIVQARVELTVSNINQALDIIAQAIVDTPIESEYYPECLFVAGTCYYSIVGQSAATPPQPGGPVGKSDSERIMAESGGPRAAATETLGLLIQMVPESRWAQLARERLKQIGAEAPPAPPEPGAQPPAGAPPAAAAAADAAPMADGTMQPAGAPAMTPGAETPAPPADNSSAGGTNAPPAQQEQSKAQP